MESVVVVTEEWLGVADGAAGEGVLRDIVDEFREWELRVCKTA